MDQKQIERLSDKELWEAYENAKHMKTVYATSQLVKKISLNSLYGSTGSRFFSLFDKRVAQATTLCGQAFIRTSGRAIGDYISKIVENKTKVKSDIDPIIGGDTDSLYIDLFPLYDSFYLKSGKSLSEDSRTDFYDECCKTIEKKCLEPVIEKMVTSLNTYQNCLNMKRETICAGSDKTGFCGFWVAKKRYALRVNDNEGLRYEHPKLKIMGLAQVQSSTPKICRDNLSEATRLMIEEGPEVVREYIKSIEKEFMSKPVEEIALPRSVSDVLKYTENGRPIKGTPVQSKAAINHNYLVDQLGLEKSIQKIRDGEKLKFLYLNRNQYGFDVIGFRDKLPKEFDLERFVNKETHFEKAFLKPLTDMMGACGWAIEEISTLEDFF